MVRKAKWLIALAVMAGLAQTARAGLIPTAVTVTPSGGQFSFHYTIVLPSNYTLKTGDYFTVYDFKGYVASMNVEPSGWKFTSTMLGVTPTHIAPTDSPTLPNLTWTYLGGNIVGSHPLGTFSAQSIYGNLAFGDFASRDHNTSDGRAVGNITTTYVPSLLKDAPEPATLALLGMALPALGLYRLVRRKK